MLYFFDLASTTGSQQCKYTSLSHCLGCALLPIFESKHYAIEPPVYCKPSSQLERNNPMSFPLFVFEIIRLPVSHVPRKAIPQKSCM